MDKEVNVNLILEFRKVNKMTIKEFCKRNNIETITYYKIIKNKRASIKTLYFIARTMKVNITDLLKEN